MIVALIHIKLITYQLLIFLVPSFYALKNKRYAKFWQFYSLNSLTVNVKLTSIKLTVNR